MSGAGGLAVFVLVILVLMVGGIYMSRLMVKRALRNVILAFRRKGAIDPKTAKTLEELGLGRRRFVDSLARMRDYKPYATRMLVQANIIIMTSDGRFYLSEDQLKHSNIANLVKTE